MDYIMKYLGGESEDKTYPDEYFTDYIKKSNLLKDSTKKIYLSKLDNIRLNFFEKPVKIWWILQHPELYEKALEKFVSKIDPRVYDSPSKHIACLYTRILVSLFKHHRELQEENKELFMKWKNMKTRLGETLEDHYLSGQKTTRQDASFIPFDKIIEIRDELRDGSIEKLILSLYTMIPPVRSDFQNVRIYEKMPNKKENKNFIVLGDVNKLFLQEYKTDENYGTIEIQLPKELVNQIKYSLTEKPRDYLFVNRFGSPYDKKNSYSTWINNIVRKVVNNPHFTLTMFRHIYLSRPDVSIQDLPMVERRKIAKSMGHSIQQQNNYIFKDDKK